MTWTSRSAQINCQLRWYTVRQSPQTEPWFLQRSTESRAVSGCRRPFAVSHRARQYLHGGDSDTADTVSRYRARGQTNCCLKGGQNFSSLKMPHWSPGWVLNLSHTEHFNHLSKIKKSQHAGHYCNRVGFFFFNYLAFVAVALALWSLRGQLDECWNNKTKYIHRACVGKIKFCRRDTKCGGKLISMYSPDKGTINIPPQVTGNQVRWGCVPLPSPRCGRTCCKRQTLLQFIRGRLCLLKWTSDSCHGVRWWWPRGKAGSGGRDSRGLSLQCNKIKKKGRPLHWDGKFDFSCSTPALPFI